MIRYSLRCTKAHTFDSWFASAGAFDALADAHRLECPVCGSHEVQKAMMAPRVGGGETEGPAQPTEKLSEKSAAEQFLSQLRSHVEKNSDYVGPRFASEARRMHLGETPERAIHGEAAPEEARSLIEDGVPVLPLPFKPGQKTN